MLSVCFVEDLDYQVEEKIQKIKTTLTSVIERYVAGEEIRIWYSYNPDELCGMYWLMKQPVSYTHLDVYKRQVPQPCSHHLQVGAGGRYQRQGCPETGHTLSLIHI